jgi:hypothetical protein
MVSSHEQIRRCLVESAIALTISCTRVAGSGCGRGWPELPESIYSEYILIVLKSAMLV